MNTSFSKRKAAQASFIKPQREASVGKQGLAKVASADQFMKFGMQGGRLFEQAALDSTAVQPASSAPARIS